MHTVADITAYLDDFAPSRLAAAWDNVGLLLGDPSHSVERIMTCLTVTPETVAEAVADRVQLLVTHHPILFRPIKRLTAGCPEERMVLDLAAASIAVYSPHTAFDNTMGGINDRICRRLSLTAVTPLRQHEARQCKIVVFVPESDLDKVSEALFAAGAGHIGNYSECSFRLTGTGTFFGAESTNPTVGQKGRREEVAEVRLEAICPEAIVDQVITSMRRAHSYEEPAYDVYPLRGERRGAEGEGRIGELSSGIALAELAKRVKSALHASHFQTVGDPDRQVSRVAVVCGAGGEFIADAAAAAADVLLTGEARFHDYQAARSRGLALLLPGHYASERCGVEELAELLQKRCPELQVWASRRESDPISLSL